MLIVISYTNPEPIFRQIINQLRTAITTGELESGEKLPSIREMAVELKVSVITVKRAYSELEAEGMLTTRPGLGSFVAEVDQELVKVELWKDYRTIFQGVVDSATAHGFPKRNLQQLLEELLWNEENEQKN